MAGPSAGYPDLADGVSGLDHLSPSDVGAYLAVTEDLSALPGGPAEALPIGATVTLGPASDVPDPSTLPLDAAVAMDAAQLADPGPMPPRSLNVPGSRPYSSGRYASAVPVWLTERQQNGSSGQLTQLTQHAQQLQQAQKQRQQQELQQQQQTAAAHLPQGAIFQAPPGAPVASHDAQSLSAPAQVRSLCSALLLLG